MDREQQKKLDVQVQNHEEHYLDAISRAPEMLLASSREQYVRLPFQTSIGRGYQPVFSRDVIDAEQTPVFVIANTGALDYNSPAFINPSLEPHIAAIMAEDRVAYVPRMLAYTKPEDTFIYETTNVENSEQVLHMIADFYATLGIEVTRKFYAVASTREWVAMQKGEKPILFAAAIDPLGVVTFANSEEEAEALMDHAAVNIAAYTKNGAERLWASQNVPVPKPTHYVRGGRIGQEEVQAALMDGLHRYGEIVVSTYDGAGGDGVQFHPHHKVAEVVGAHAEGKGIQLQGRLPLAASPCTIAYIEQDGSVTKLLVSHQRFAAPGVHGGNYWVRDGVESHGLPEDFDNVVDRSLQALAQAGVVGQINVDSLIVSERTAREFTNGRQTLKREANIRPAGSSVILRMREGRINGKRIDRINTQSSIKIPFSILTSEKFREFLTQEQQEELMCGLYNYDLINQKGAFAFLAAEGVSSQQLVHFENVITQKIKEFAIQ